MGKLLLAAVVFAAVTADYVADPPGNRIGDVTLYAPEVPPRHFRNVRFDWSSSAPGCVKLYPAGKPALWFCGTYEVRDEP